MEMFPVTLPVKISKLSPIIFMILIQFHAPEVSIETYFPHF